MASSFVRRGRRYRDAPASRARARASNRDGDDANREGDDANRDERRAPASNRDGDDANRDGDDANRDGAGVAGARAGPHGRALVSSGHGDADALLGGGHALGSLAACASDGASAHAEALFGACFVAEGAATARHRTCWVRAGREGRAEATRTLPRRVVEREGERATTTDDRASEASEASDGLRIAWQYRRYLRQGRNLDDSGVGAARATTTARTTKKRNLRAPDVCQTYDWTREEDEATLRDADVSFERFGGDEGGDEGDGEGETDAWARCFEFVETFVRGLRDEEVGRVLVQPETPRDEGEWAACARLARALKGLVRETNVACVMILPLALAPARWGAMIRHVADCAIDVQPLEGPTSEIESLLPEPHLCVGLVAVRKLQFQGGVVSPLTRMDRVYALQMRRKRMAIKPLQIRPEEERKKSGGESACGAVEGVGLDDF